MPIIDPLTQRSTGLPQSHPRLREEGYKIPLTQPTGLTPCWRNRVVCPKCGQYERLYPESVTSVPHICDKCGKALVASDACKGWTAHKLPHISENIRIKNGMMDTQASSKQRLFEGWSFNRLDGSKPKVPTRRKGDR